MRVAVVLALFTAALDGRRDGQTFAMPGAILLFGNYNELRVVMPGFLTLLGVTPVLGRAFEVEDVGRPVAILSHAFWRGKLAADPGVIGHPIVLGGQSHTIVGVLPERFIFELNPSDVWRPLPVTPAQAADAS